MAPPEHHKTYTSLQIWNRATEYEGMALVPHIGAEIHALVCGHKNCLLLPRGERRCLLAKSVTVCLQISALRAVVLFVTSV